MRGRKEGGKKGAYRKKEDGREERCRVGLYMLSTGVKYPPSEDSILHELVVSETGVLQQREDQVPLPPHVLLCRENIGVLNKATQGCLINVLQGRGEGGRRGEERERGRGGGEGRGSRDAQCCYSCRQ